MQLIERLKIAKSSISDPRDWGQGDDRECACALDALRVNVDETDAHHEVQEAIMALNAVLPDSFEEDPNNWNHPVAQFNDDAGTTHGDIMDLYDRAIAKAEGR